MKLRKRATRARIITKREAPWLESIKSEKAPQQLENTLYKPLKNEKDESISSLKIKQEEAKDDSLNKLKSAAETEDQGDAYIKQEDIAKKEGLVDAICNKGFTYRCCTCETKFSDHQSAMHHRTSVHNVNLSRTTIRHAQMEPDYNDPNNACRSCGTTYPSKKHYVAHLRKTHYMYLELKRVGPLHGEVPDPRDPNFHCLSCKKTYSNKFNYKTHLKQTHDIIVPPIHRTAIKNTDVLPDWNDPAYHCPACERQYKNKAVFASHCKYVHKMTSPNKQQNNERKLPNLHDPNYYCMLCDIKHKNEQSYRSHCYTVHGMRIIISNASDQNTNLNNECSICERSFTARFSLKKHLFIMHKMDNDSAPKSRNEKPHINEPSNYCRVCDKTYRYKYLYKHHLFSVHRIKEKDHGKEESRPDVDDPNNYCRICQRTYTSRNNYRMHLARIHQVMLPKRAAAYDPNHFPDPHDPNWYCCVCKTYSKSRSRYRGHCRGVHRMKIAPLVKINVNPNAEINSNDPNFYCAKCDRKSKTRECFLIHLRKIHGVKVSLKEKVNPKATIDPNDPNWYYAQY